VRALREGCWRGAFGGAGAQRREKGGGGIACFLGGYRTVCRRVCGAFLMLMNELGPK
jgi:hypothetical protein